METKIKPLVIGLGGGGCRIAAQFARLGYGTLAINTAAVDLAGLDYIHPDFRLHIGGGEGAGQIPTLGRRAILTAQKQITQALSAQSAAYYLITVTLGGGTGSAVSTLLDTVGDLGQCVIIAALPEKWRGADVENNATQAMRQLHEYTAKYALFLIENARIVQTFEKTHLRNYYAHANVQIATIFDRFVRIAANKNVFFDGIDANDLRRVLFTPGYAVMAEHLLTAGHEQFTAQLIGGEKGLFANVDIRTARRIAIAIEGSDAALRRVNMNRMTAAMQELRVQTSAGLFFGTYVDPYQNLRALMLASGLAYPACLSEMKLTQRAETTCDNPFAQEEDIITDDVDFSLFL